MTHGMCPACEDDELAITDLNIANARVLQSIQRQLFDAGQRNDLAAAKAIIEGAATANIRSVDILMGVSAPMLYQIGEDWKRGYITVAEEGRFTAFCEGMFGLIATLVDAAQRTKAADAQRIEFLLMNAPGNSHMLAIRFLALWLKDKGMRTETIDKPISRDELVAQVNLIKPETLLISMALEEQRDSVITIVERMEALPKSFRPRIVVGGYAVKIGGVAAIPGAELMTDVSLL
jgi:hypothetical protein